MHGHKIDSSHHERRRPEHEDSDNSEELDTEEDDEEKCLDMNEYYDNEEDVNDVGDCGGGDEWNEIQLMELKQVTLKQNVL